MFKIILRTKNYWSPAVYNRNPDTCDICHNKLFVAPHDTPYCDAIHTTAEITGQIIETLFIKNPAKFKEFAKWLIGEESEAYKAVENSSYGELFAQVLEDYRSIVAENQPQEIQKIFDHLTLI